MTAQGLDKRFTPQASAFMKSLLETAASTVIVPQDVLNYKVLQHFKAVYLHDCSTVTLPDAFRESWQGVGGYEGTSQVALKLDAGFELKTGTVDIKLLQGRDADNRSPHAQCQYEKGTLRL